MKKVQKFKTVYKDGKQESKEAVGKARSFMDSIADDVLIESETLVKKVEEDKRALQTIDLYEEVAEDIDKMKKDELIAFAKTNEIEIEETKSKGEILEAIKQALNQK